MNKISRCQLSLIILCTIGFLTIQSPGFSQSSRKGYATTPTYRMIDQKGDSIKQTSDLSKITSLTVLAGTGFRVKALDIDLQRGRSIIKSMTSTSDKVNIEEFKAGSVAGDKIRITIKKVAEINGDKEGKITEPNYLIVIPIN